MFKHFFGADVKLEIGKSMLDEDNCNRIPYIVRKDDGSYKVFKLQPITGELPIPSDLDS